MRLNSEKCVIGAKAGKLLGYLISRRGIKANLGKNHNNIKMASPTTLKGVQCLAGRLVALSCFVAKSVEHNLPFFKMLRGSGPFMWTQERHDAFDALKAHLSNLKTLAIHLHGKGLLLYLSTSISAVSIVLVREEEKEGRSNQRVVYYILDALAEAKTYFM